MLRRLTYTLVCTMLLVGCSHKDIDCPGPVLRPVDIIFEWDNAPGAEVEGMTLYFFSSGPGAKVWRFDVSGNEGGRVELPYGGYRMVTFNNDLPGVKTVGAESFGTLAVKARQAGETDAIASAGMLYGAVVNDVCVSCCGVRYTLAGGGTKECGKGLIRCSPDSLGVQYTVVFDNTGGLGAVRSASVFLNGPGEAYSFADGRSLGFERPLLEALEIDRGSRRMSGTAMAFGPASFEDGLSEMTFVFTRNDGKTFSKKLSIAPENLNIISRHNVLIHIRDFNIPDSGDKPPGDIGGIDVDVDGWQSIEIDVFPTIS